MCGIKWNLGLFRTPAGSAKTVARFARSTNVWCCRFDNFLRELRIQVSICISAWPIRSEGRARRLIATSCVSHMLVQNSDSFSFFCSVRVQTDVVQVDYTRSEVTQRAYPLLRKVERRCCAYQAKMSWRHRCTHAINRASARVSPVRHTSVWDQQYQHGPTVVLQHHQVHRVENVQRDGLDAHADVGREEGASMSGRLTCSTHTRSAHDQVLPATEVRRHPTRMCPA